MHILIKLPNSIKFVWLKYCSQVFESTSKFSLNQFGELSIVGTNLSYFCLLCNQLFLIKSKMIPGNILFGLDSIISATGTHLLRNPSHFGIVLFC